MRNYLYIWNSPAERFIVASGVEFKHIGHSLNNIVLLKHEYGSANIDPESRLEYLTNENIQDLIEEEVYDYGDFCWAEFGSTPLKSFDDQTIAELLFFAHKGKILNESIFDRIDGRFLASSHDDGWYLKLYYREWTDVRRIIDMKILELDVEPEMIEKIRSGDGAYFLTSGSTIDCMRTYDIDSILQTYN